MNRRRSLFTLLLILLGLSACRAPGAAQPLVVHDVYFTLEDDSDERVSELVEACHEWLGELPGIAFFAAGSRDLAHTGDVNDKEFDVSLHVWFESPEAYASYGEDPKHLDFIDAFKANWSGVQVFDSTATGH